MPAKRKKAQRPPKRVRQAQKAYDDALRAQVYLERLKTGMVRDFNRYVNQVERAVVSSLRALEVDNLGELQRTEIKQLLRSLQRQQEAIYAEGLLELSEKLRGVSVTYAEQEATSLSSWAQTRATKAGIATPAPSTVWDTVRAKPLTATGDTVEGFLEAYSQNAVRKMNGAVRNGWSQGKTVGEMVRDIRGTKSRNYQDGLITISRRDAETAVRTSVQHVANTARQATWEQNKDVVKGYLFIATLDGRTTSQCRSLDRQRFKLNRGPVPPLHHNCRSTTIADLGDEFDFLDQGATRSSLSGAIPAQDTFYDWLKTQEPSFVKEAIGAKRAQLFIDGGLTADEFARLNIGRNFAPLTLDEMRKKNPSAFKRAGL